MFDQLPLEEIRDASEAAFAKIGHDPARIRELADEDLGSVAAHLKTTRPLVEGALIALCGGVDEANAALARVMKFSQRKLAKLVRAAHAGMKTHRNPSTSQFAALVLDVQVGCGAVQVEQERRAAARGGRMN